MALMSSLESMVNCTLPPPGLSGVMAQADAASHVQQMTAPSVPPRRARLGNLTDTLAPRFGTATIHHPVCKPYSAIVKASHI
jgi:hypothetical protein